MSNLTAPQLVRHLLFTIYKVPSLEDLQQEKCVNVQVLPEDEKCMFVQEAADCLTESSFVPYLYLLYCDFSTSSRYLGVAICVGWLVLMFFLLGKSANDFFCPALTVIAKVLGLSESLAGVTVLAFGNGSPDIFTSLAGAPRGRSELIFGELIGSGLFVTTVIAGAIITIRPFKVMDRSFLRDIIFYLGAVYWTFYIFYKGVVTTWEAVGFIILYLVYITVVLTERFYIKSQPPIVIVDAEQDIEEARSDASKSSFEASSRSLPESPTQDKVEQTKRTRSHTVSTVQELAIHQERLSHLWSQGLREEIMSSPEVGPDETTPLLSGTHYPAKEHSSKLIWRELKAGLSEVTGPTEANQCFPSKCLHWLQAPVVLSLTLLVPVVNYTAPKHGWCRPLNALHCFTCPLFCLFATQVATVSLVWPWLQLWVIAGVIGAFAAVWVFYSTEPDRPPRYHNVFAFLGFAGSVVTIYMVANEVVNLLRAIGILSNLSDTMLGMTVLAWGNSIGDFITNFSIARQGFERMGFSACFGGPLFNILLGIGISFTMATIESGENKIYIHYGEVGPLIALFLALSLVSSLIAFPLMGFTTKRSYGIYLLSLYSLFLCATILLEVDVLPLNWLPASRIAAPVTKSPL
ncbi:mitochondrial sodium/calcium exchanger protein-like [Neocloeon triangulifer]|uniref:mitochondrial sodium/calcium exchanger protein-like n=1 Tax=Neocloeon triangulifer TaxID=2078957 RepID=UPI00286F3996|nr:mitochondrial sodium/calcium exchanger protein-like [Neocloeon triangulifer]